MMIPKETTAEGTTSVATTGALSASIPLQVSERRSRLADSERWPRAWRLLFIAGSAVLLWAAILFVVRWI